VEHNIPCFETLFNCPVCSASTFKPFISCEDFTVSHETFHITECENCGLKITNPRPTEGDIIKYYESSDYISHSNTSKGIVNALYQIARRFTIKRKKRLIKSICPDGKSLLDFGCGTGEFLAVMKNDGWNSKGIEPGVTAREFAKNSHLLDVIEPQEMHKIASNFFDIITLWHVLEHVHKLNESVEELKRILKDNGKLVVAVPNNNASEQLIYKQFWAAYDVPRHLYHFNVESIAQFFIKHKMTIVKTYSMPLDGFYVSLLSEKYKKNKFGFIHGLYIGTIALFKSFINKARSSSLIFIIEKEKPLFSN
jgi:ubiquinone/menaquinone biosynthesis C-methylase UbiE/transcription elongation factor Elf1